MEIERVYFLRFSGIVVIALITLAAIIESIPSYIFSVAYPVLAFIYTKWLWKIITPRLNLDGDWGGFTEYQELVHQGQDFIPELPIKLPHQVKFRQSPFGLSIESSGGKDIVSWNSDAIKLYEKGELILAYTVNRKNNVDGFPTTTIGYEKLRVLDRTWFGTPRKLSGKFYHAAEPNKNLFTGESTYHRIEKFKKIRKKRNI